VFLNLGEAAPSGGLWSLGSGGVPCGGVSRAPGNGGGDQTSQSRQKPWCQSALPRCATVTQRGETPTYPARQARTQLTSIVAPRGGGGIPLANIW
jgi:hypothetical protein